MSDIRASNAALDIALADAIRRRRVAENQRRKERDQEGRRSFVYFITCETENFPIKIGTAGDVDTRLKSIQTGLPWPVRKLLLIKGGRGTERELHEQFSEYRLRGEWFVRSSAILEYIAEHQQ